MLEIRTMTTELDFSRGCQVSHLVDSVFIRQTLIRRVVFDDIFKGCNGVCRVSHASDYNDQEYVERVCKHIIESVNKAETVTRVIVTSSIAAVISEVDLQELVKRPVCYEDRYPDEQNPKRTSQKGQGYSMAKVVAQRALSDAAGKNGN